MAFHLTLTACLAHADGVAHSLAVGEGVAAPIGFHDPPPTFSWKGCGRREGPVVNGEHAFPITPHPRNQHTHLVPEVVQFLKQRL